METTVSDTTHSLNTPTYSPSSKRVTTYINIDIDKNIDVPPELHEKLTELSLSQFSNSSNADELSQSSEVMVSSVDISRTKEPMYQPSKSPSTSKQKGSSTFPSLVPSISTSLPSDTPSITPTRYLTINPSHFPSYAPSITPTRYLTINPSHFPSYEPSITPSIVFSAEPSFTPSKSPSQTDSETPSTVSSLLPTIVHSLKPSTTSSLRPSLRPKNVSPPSAESIPLSEQSRFSPTSMPSNTDRETFSGSVLSMTRKSSNDEPKTVRSRFQVWPVLLVAVVGAICAAYFVIRKTYIKSVDLIQKENVDVDEGGSIVDINTDSRTDIAVDLETMKSKSNIKHDHFPAASNRKSRKVKSTEEKTEKKLEIKLNPNCRSNHGKSAKNGERLRYDYGHPRIKKIHTERQLRGKREKQKGKGRESRARKERIHRSKTSGYYTSEDELMSSGLEKADKYTPRRSHRKRRTNRRGRNRVSPREKSRTTY